MACPTGDGAEMTNGGPDDAIVLAGGLGTRLRSTIGQRPKPLASIGGRPFLDWILSALSGQGIARVVLATGYQSGAFDEHLPRWRSSGLDVVLSQENEPLGTAGAARLALEATRTPHVLVFNGDSLCPMDLRRLDGDPMLWLVGVPDVSRFGSVGIGPKGVVTSFHEKAAAIGEGFINAGIYRFDRRLLESLPRGRSVSMEREVLPGLVGKGLRAVVGDGPFVDIGTPESYAEADELFSRSPIEGASS